MNHLDLLGFATDIGQELLLGELRDHRDLATSLFREPIPEEPEKEVLEAAGALQGHAVGDGEDRPILPQEVREVVDVTCDVVYIPLVTPGPEDVDHAVEDALTLSRAFRDNRANVCRQVCADVCEDTLEAEMLRATLALEEGNCDGGSGGQKVLGKAVSV